MPPIHVDQLGSSFRQHKPDRLRAALLNCAVHTVVAMFAVAKIAASPSSEVPIACSDRHRDAGRNGSGYRHQSRAPIDGGEFPPNT